MSPPDYPSAWFESPQCRFRFARLIVAPPRLARPTSGYAVRTKPLARRTLARDSIWQGNCNAADHPSRSNIPLLRITFPIEYPISNCPAKSGAASFLRLDPKRQCRRHTSRFRRAASDRDLPSSSSYPNGHIDDLAAQVGNVLPDVFGTDLVCRTVEILRQLHADVVRAWLRAPVAGSADRLFPTVNYWIDFARHVLAERGACVQGSAAADSLAQAAARLRKVKRNRERGAVSATAPKLVR
jgi:hypothetical protein